MLIGSITNYGSLQGEVNNYGNSLTGFITNASLLGGQVVGMRGLKGDKGDTGDTGATGADGADGFSPSASVSKVGHTATITITDKDGTTTAEVHDGSGGGDVTDVTVDGTSIVDSDGVAELETATQLRNGLMTALDKQKLDGIASGAEVNVQSDWNEADSTDDAYIKNKPSIPTKVSELNNDSGFITTETDPTVPSWAKQASKPSYTFSEIGSKPSTISGYGITDAKISSGTITLGSDSITPLTSFTETDPVFTASDAYGITSSDITNWDNSYDGKISLDTSAASGTDHDLYAAIVALGWQNDVIEA